MSKKRILSGLLVAAILITTIGIGLGTDQLTVSATKNNASSIAIADAMPKDTSAILGSDENPLTILEIVPNKTMAKIGYLIPGCEPIDMSKITTDESAITAYRSTIGGNGTGAGEVVNKVTKKFIDELPKDTVVNAIVYGDEKIAADLSITQDGNWKNYGTWNSNYSSYSEIGYYELVEENQGLFSLEGEGDDRRFVYAGPNQGNYNWVADETATDYTTDYDADQVWMKRTESHCYVYTEAVFTNNDLLVQGSFGKSSDEFTSQVITLTPAEVSSEEGLSLIDTADMIVIQTDTETSIVELWKNYNKAGAVYDASAPDTFGSNDDISWEAAMRIVRREASNHPAAMMIDRSKIERSGNTTNIWKMYLMLIQFGPKTFLELFEDDITAVNLNGTNTGSYKGATEWTSSTFMGNWVNGAFENMKYVQNPWITGTENGETLSESIYVTNGNNVIPHDYSTQKIYEAKNNKNIFDYIEAATGSRPEYITPSQAVAYILTDKGYKTQLNILEVEGCAQYYADDEDWNVYLSTIIPWFEGDYTEDIHVTKMTTAELNGDIDDLNANYDMILIGDKQDETNGASGYNDSALGNRIYTAVGDLASDPGTDGQTSSNARYEAVDISQKKLNEFRDYLLAGKPIIMADALYNGSTPDTNKMDSDSNIYELAASYQVNQPGTLLVKGADKFYNNKTQYFSSILWFAMANDHGEIQFFSGNGESGQPTKYTYETASDGTISNVTYLDSRTFIYRFMIKGVSGETYTAKLFIDQDGDGVYDASAKEVAKLHSLGQTDIPSEEIANLSVTELLTGTAVDATNLKPNTYYTLSRTLPQDFQGILPWKLEVTENSNIAIRDSKVDYTAVKAKASDKVQVNILQMNLSSDMSQEASTLFNSNASWRSAFLNFADTTTNTGAKFKKYLDCVDEYKINLQYQHNVEWYQKYGEGGSAGETVEQRTAAWKAELDTYDMLILGFNDMSTFTSNPVFYEGFKYFEEQGKSIIMSHDMVAAASVYQSRNWLYNDYVSEIRTMTGQRRRYLSADGSSYSYDKTQSLGRIINLLPSRSYRLDAYTNRYNTNDNLYITDIAEVSSASEYADNANYLYNLERTTGTHKDRVLSQTRFGWSTDYETTYVATANQGQITEYPYDIPSVIKVQSTHTQYFALDLESASDGDVVTWYNLTDARSIKYADGVAAVAGNSYNAANADGTGIYSSRDGDSQNNYYIYNKGNITYTGLGHYNNSGGVDTGLPDDEVKLFVNTMISAFRFTAAKPDVDITNESGSNNSNESVIYVDIDESNITMANDTQIPVQLKIRDDSFYDVTDRKYYLQMSDVNGADTSINNRVTAKGDGTALVLNANNSYDVTPADGVYTFHIPYGELREKGEVEIELLLTSEYQNNKNETVTTTTTKRVVVMPMPLFSLN